MKVYVVVEWAIDYFYKVWGVFSSKNRAEQFIKKLREMSSLTSWGLDGELHIDEVELDDNGLYLVECRWFDESGDVVRAEYTELTKDKSYHEKDEFFERKVVIKDEI